jgi:hypothetical protein
VPVLVRVAEVPTRNPAGKVLDPCGYGLEVLCVDGHESNSSLIETHGQAQWRQEALELARPGEVLGTPN